MLIVIAGIYFFHSFVVPMLAALVLAFASWPIYSRLVDRVGGSRTVAATLAILFILVFLVVPISIAVTYTVGEVREWIAWAGEVNKFGAPPPAWILALPVAGSWLGQQWTDYVGSPGALGELVQIVSGAHIGNIYRAVVAAGDSAFHLVLTLLFMLITLFFVYRDGASFTRQLDLLGERILPTRWERISRVVPATISSTVTGMTLIAIGEGIVLGIAYYLAGVPSPVTFGLITGIVFGFAAQRSRFCLRPAPRVPQPACCRSPVTVDAHCHQRRRLPRPLLRHSPTHRRERIRQTSRASLSRNPSRS